METEAWPRARGGGRGESDARAEATTMQEVERIAVRHRVALALVGLLVLLLVALLPVALVSVFYNVMGAPYEQVYSWTAPASAAPDGHVRLHVQIVGIDPWQELVTLRVAGNHICPPGCNWQDRVVFFSLSPDSPGAEGLPPSATVTLPATDIQVTQTLQLPISSQPIRYPFDVHALSLAVALQHIGPDNVVHTLTPAEAQGRLFLTLQDRVPLLTMKEPTTVDPATVQTPGVPFDYLAAQSMVFHRPLWLPVLTILLLLLIAAAAAFAVFLRPWLELIATSGTLVLGIWGIRAVMVASNITYTTMVDLWLALILLFLLGGTTLRVLLALCERNRLRLRRPVRARLAWRAAGQRTGQDEAAPQPSSVGGGDERQRQERVSE
jgi:hypothetical protein